MAENGIVFLDRLEGLRFPDESDSAFARRIGISLTTLRDWHLLRDAGRNFEPKIKTARVIAENLSVPLEWLLLGIASNKKLSTKGAESHGELGQSR